MSCANIYKMLGNRVDAREQYGLALDQFEMVGLEKHEELFEN